MAPYPDNHDLVYHNGQAFASQNIMGPWQAAISGAVRASALG